MTGLLLAAGKSGVRVNVTPSMPVGLWRITGGVTLARGDIISLCLPDRQITREAVRRGYIPAGTCLGGTMPLLKPIAALGGDLVTVSSTGIAVNGMPAASSAPLARDEAGRPLRPVPPGSYRLAADEIWLLSGYDPRSFDSRYFGAVPVANVQGVARPLWVLR
jgi:conjugative transfer signal peptidase TraF